MPRDVCVLTPVHVCVAAGAAGLAATLTVPELCFLPAPTLLGASEHEALRTLPRPAEGFPRIYICYIQQSPWSDPPLVRVYQWTSGRSLARNKGFRGALSHL